jgi:hypothetical protein
VSLAKTQKARRIATERTAKKDKGKERKGRRLAAHAPQSTQTVTKRTTARVNGVFLFSLLAVLSVAVLRAFASLREKTNAGINR